MDSKSLGVIGERLAEKYLIDKGYIILERNFISRLGEIDLVAKDKNVVVFVEVKSRMSLSFGMPEESVHYLKQRKLIKLAQLYLLNKYRTVDILSRFDVVTVYKNKEGEVKLEHIYSAFELNF